MPDLQKWSPVEYDTDPCSLLFLHHLLLFVRVPLQNSINFGALCYILNSICDPTCREAGYNISH